MKAVHLEDQKQAKPQAKLKKKQAYKGIFKHFLENFDQKIALCWCALPPQNKYTLAPKAPLKYFFGFHHQIWISQNSTKGGPWGKKKHPPQRTPPPPSNPLLLLCINALAVDFLFMNCSNKDFFSKYMECLRYGQFWYMRSFYITLYKFLFTCKTWDEKSN